MNTVEDIKLVYIIRDCRESMCDVNYFYCETSLNAMALFGLFRNNLLHSKHLITWNKIPQLLTCIVIFFFSIFLYMLHYLILQLIKASWL